MNSLLQHLKERKLVQWGLGYLAVAWFALEGFGFVAENLSWPPFLVRAAIVLAGAGFLATLVLAWYHGEKGRQRMGATELALLCIVALGAGVGVLLVRGGPEAEGSLGGATAERDRAPSGSIAVLPFVNVSQAPEDEYFSDGLTEELINTLARVAGLHVTARSSAFAFKGERRDLREIGRILNVRTVLEGSVRREGESLRIAAQLVNVEDGFNLWSESYERQVGSVFAIQDEIAGAIVDTLRVQLAADSRERLEVSRTDNLEAYNLYLLGRFHRNKLTAPGLQQAAEAFEQAIGLAPEYAPARAGLAGVHSMMGYFGGLAPELAYPSSMEQAERALALDPRNAEAYLVRAMTRFLYDWDWAAAEADFVRGLEVSPGSGEVRWGYGLFLAAMGRHDEAIETTQEAIEIDPLSLPYIGSEGWHHLGAKRPAAAIERADRLLTMDESFGTAHWLRGAALEEQGNLETAIEELETAVRLTGGIPNVRATLAHAYARAGRTDEAQTVVEALIDLRSLPEAGFVAPSAIALGLAGLGEEEEALDWLETGVEERDGWLVYLTNGWPRFEELRAHPRFQEILRRVGVPPAGDNASESSTP